MVLAEAERPRGFFGIKKWWKWHINMNSVWRAQLSFLVSKVQVDCTTNYQVYYQLYINYISITTWCFKRWLEMVWKGSLTTTKFHIFSRSYLVVKHYFENNRHVQFLRCIFAKDSLLHILQFCLAWSHDALQRVRFRKDNIYASQMKHLSWCMLVKILDCSGTKSHLHTSSKWSIIRSTGHLIRSSPHLAWEFSVYHGTKHHC